MIWSDDDSNLNLNLNDAALTWNRNEAYVKDPSSYSGPQKEERAALLSITNKTIEN